VFMYVAALSLEFAALVIFRVRLPDASRSFRIPFERFGLVYVCAAPCVLVAAIASSALSDPTGYLGLAAVLPGVAVAGVVIYRLGRGRTASGTLASGYRGPT